MNCEGCYEKWPDVYTVGGAEIISQITYYKCNFINDFLYQPKSPKSQKMTIISIPSVGANSSDFSQHEC